MNPQSRELILEEEIIILRNSGEIPEIALHSSLYYLEEDEEGPALNLRQDELDLLYDAALERAREIVLRDLNPENRDLSLYRGPARSITNWFRLQNFCQRIDRKTAGFDETVAEALIAFLKREKKDVQSSNRTSSVNCSASALKEFAAELNLDSRLFPEGWESLCMSAGGG